MELSYVSYIDAPRGKVWKALCEGQPIAALMPGTELRTTLEPSTPYAYVGKRDDKEMEYVTGTIIAAEPDARLEMTYRAMGNPAESRVEYRLEEIAKKYTKLSVVQDCFAQDDPNYETNRDGWPKLISNLKSFLETGRIMNFYAE